MAVNLPESADFEGYLEKHGTGTVSKLLGKQKKTWCFLQGAWLYCHQSNNKRSSVVSSIDLTEAQMIRKINSDKSGLQFEIVTKFKNITFTAGTADECNEWIKHLQKAMTLKDNINVPTTDRKSFNLHHYDEIDVNKEHKPSVQKTSSSSSQYEDIDKFHTSVSPKADPSSHYASIDDDDVFTSNNNNESSLTKPPVCNVSEYSTVIPKEQRKTPSKGDNSSSQKLTEKSPVDSSAKNKTSTENNIRNDTQKVQPSTKRKSSELTTDQDQTAVNSSKGGNESEEESIDDVQSMIPKTFPEFKEELYSLKEDDVKPITDLKNFLHLNNLDKNMDTQISTEKSKITDPFESLKAYLSSLDL